MVRLLLCCLALSGSALLAQANGNRIFSQQPHAWYIYNGDHGFGNSKWGLHLEDKWRRYDIGLGPQQNLFRTGINYRFSPSIAVTAGYAYISTHRYGEYPTPVPFPEHRFYQQAVITNKIGRLTIHNRHRLEQRQLGEMRVLPGGQRERVNWRYENRYRYMFQAVVPIKGRLGVSAYNEVMFNFGKNVAANVFDQNRAYGALTFALPKKSRLEVGYMNQLLSQRSAIIFESNHTLVVSLFNTLSFGGKN
jgi:hypothetical protein